MKLDTVLVEMMKKYPAKSFLHDIVGVQPMSAEASQIFTIRARGWALPDDNRSVYSQDDVTVLLIMGYRLAHGHNCCTGFGGKYRAPMPYWISPDEEYIAEPCEHDWSVNYLS